MTFEISLRRPFSIPRVFWAGNGESWQDYHWINQKPNTEQEPSLPGEQNRKSQSDKNKQKYRLLTDITLGEAEDAYKQFENQLLPVQENWLGRNYFCQIPLKRRRGQPPMIFGRVKTCFPSDGVVDNIEEMELYFPHQDGPPDLLHIDRDEISRGSQRQVQSYFVKVRVLASGEETVELDESAPLLSVKGFYPEFESGYLDILDLNVGNQSVYPWLYVIGSRWFRAIPESIHAEMKAKFMEMIGWGKHIFNYHPEWLTSEVNTLNRTLGFKYGFTPFVLIEPGNAQETASIVAKKFNQEIFFRAKAEK